IAEYRRVVPPVVEAQVAVARLLVQQNLRRPPAQRRWQDVTAAIDAASQAAPVELPILRAEVLAAQGEPAAARSLLEAACTEAPRSPAPVVALAALSERQDGPEAALRVLDEAQPRLGDRAEIRLARGWTWARRGGDSAAPALAKLSQDLAKF